MNICIYAPNCEDFTTNGLGPLTPLECVIEEQAAGMYELTLTHPIDDSLRWTLLSPGCIIKAPAPVRESPLYEAPATDEAVRITRQIWQVHGTTHGLYLRSGPGMNYKRIGKRYNGDEIIELEDAPDPWKKVCVAVSGAVGYMSTKYLKPVRTISEVIDPAGPVSGGVLKIGQSRDQLFRIYSMEQDSAAATVTVRALHVFYDEAANLIGGCEVSGDVNAALAAMKANLALPAQVQLHALNLRGNVHGDFSNKSPVEALLNPDTGIVAQTKAMLVRDNWDAYLLPDMVRDRGVTIRRGKNLVGVEVTTDASALATRIIPVGSKRNGDPLYLSGDGWVESPRAGEHPFPRIRRIEYDVQTGENGIASDEAARNELRRLAEAEFSEKGIDLPGYSMDVDFILLGSTAQYAAYTSLQSVHLYDTVTVIDELLGLRARVRVNGYKWNCLTGQYEGVTLGALQDAAQLQSYNLPDGGISGTKIMSNTLGGSALRNASIQYAKIAVAAVEQLCAASLTALTARIQELVAGSLTADELYAGIADITKATVERADINWADITALNAAVAAIAQAKIKTADIDFARIKDLVTDTAIITEGVGGQLFISRLAVTEANMVSLTTGELVVKGEDGHFYSLSVDAAGKVITTLKQITNGDVQDLSLNAGEKLVHGSVTAACLNAEEIFADNAVIRRLIAANLDVDALFAREAFVNLLRTGKIVGDKSITMIAGEASDAKTAAANAQNTANSASTAAANAQSAADNAQASVDNLDRLSNVEVIEGTFVQTERREGEGIHIFSKFEPKQDKTYGDPYPAGGGKNLIPFPYAEGGAGTVKKMNGITFTVLDNGAIDIVGTASADSYFVLERNADYGDTSVNALSSQNGATNGTYAASYRLLYNIGNHLLSVNILSGTSVSERIYPQVELGTVATEYAPYANTPAIEGRRSLNAGVYGKNLFNKDFDVDSYVGTGYRKYPFRAKPGATISWSLVGNSFIGNKTYAAFTDYIDYSGEYSPTPVHWIGHDSSLSHTFEFGTFKVPASGVFYLAILNRHDVAKSLLQNLMLVEGEYTAATMPAYEPYQGSIHTFDFGKNLIPYPFSAKQVVSDGVTFADNGDGTITLNGTAGSSTSYDLYAGRDIFEVGKTYVATDTTVLFAGVRRVQSGVVFTVTEQDLSAEAIRTEIRPPAGTVYSNTVLKPQLELGTVATKYAPYNAELLEQTGGMIYGGTVDWNKGEMTVEWYGKTFDGTEEYTAVDGNAMKCAEVFPKVKTVSGNTIFYGLSSHAPTNRDGTLLPGYITAYDPNNPTTIEFRRIVDTWKCESYTVDAWKAYLSAQYAAGTPVQVVYMLAEPYTIQLSPVQIATLKGINTVYIDADDGWVEFGHAVPDICDSTMPPESPVVGTFWLDRSVTPCVLRRWTGSNWETVNDVSMIETVQDAILTKQAELEAAQKETALFLKLDNTMKAVRIGQTGLTSEFRIDAFGSGVVVNDEIFSRFEASRVVFGNMEIRKPAVGGLSFDSIANK